MVLRSREVLKVKKDGRGRASYLYSTESDIQGLQRKPRECSGLLKDDSDGFGEFLGPEGSSIKEVQKL